ncbi:hypothetical protein [Amycolatopsis sp. cmx-11-12]|uniref:hypothetical protein n=1 Tax=Amycolatopsis sp. cmx-11-12 TaxID=2785795 RepID=UPI00391831E1
MWSLQPPASETNADIEAIAPLVDALPTDRRPSLTSNVLEKLQSLVSDADEASARQQLLAHTELFVTRGFVDDSGVAEVVVSTLRDTLAQSLSQ